MRTPGILALVCSLAAPLAACDAGFEDEAIVLDLRVLGIACEPPEVVMDIDLMNPELGDLEIPPVTISALVADPGDDRRLRYTIHACPPTQSHRCDGTTFPSQQIASSSIDDPEGAAGSTGITAEFLINPIILQESVRLDDLAGYGGVAVQLHLTVFPEGDEDLARAVHATKIMLYSPRLPEERVANTNPWIQEVLRDEEEPLPVGRCGAPETVPIPVAPATTLRFDPVEPEGVREDYVLPTFDGDVREITENLRYKWFASAGNWAPSESGGAIDPFGNVPPLYANWTSPEEPGLVSVWVVQRDERGGQSWLEYCFDVGGP